MMAKAKIIKIGNSQGVRIPKALLKESKLGEEVEMSVENGKIILRSYDRFDRTTWEKKIVEALKKHSNDDEDFMLWDMTSGDGIL